MSVVDEVNAQVCGDCVAFMVNGDLPWDDDRNNEIVEGCEGFAVILDTDEVGAFSWSGCDCCKSKGTHVYDVVLWDIHGQYR